MLETVDPRDKMSRTKRSRIDAVSPNAPTLAHMVIPKLQPTSLPNLESIFSKYVPTVIITFGARDREND